jgi:NAD(P)-dependent dehydrogenase (short-subunit alcohol dehydrogenase family)
MGDELSGKVAIVTGGAGGLGGAIVERFLEEGARVVIADVDADRGTASATRLGETVAFQETDVADAQQVQAAIDFAVGHFGGLHVMVNNAGISSSRRRFLDDELADFDRVMAVNLYGVMVGIQRSARHMAANGGGSIVNITSIGGINPGAGLMTYRAAKAAVVHLSQSTAIDLAEHSIRVNCIAPAHIATAINASYDQSQIVRLMQPLQRLGQPSDVADAVAFLAGERAAQITGVVLPVDGGTTAGPPPIDAKKVMIRPPETT